MRLLNERRALMFTGKETANIADVKVATIVDVDGDVSR